MTFFFGNIYTYFYLIRNFFFAIFYICIFPWTTYTAYTCNIIIKNSVFVQKDFLFFR